MHILRIGGLLAMLLAAAAASAGVTLTHVHGLSYSADRSPSGDRAGAVAGRNDLRMRKLNGAMS
jgi:hypothetical protein